MADCQLLKENVGRDGEINKDYVGLWAPAWLGNSAKSLILGG